MEIFLNYITTTFNENPFGQTLGLLALFVSIIAFVTSKDNRFLIFMAISSFIWGLHFYYIDLKVAAYISFFDILKNLLALKYKKNEKIFYFLLISYFLIGIFTFEPNSLISIIPAFNSLLSVFLIYYFDGIKLKLGFLFTLFLWFLFNYFGDSLGGMISDIILFVSGIIGVFNILRENKKYKF